MIIIVDRQSYIAWCAGWLLDRDQYGHVIVGDNTDHVAADAAIARGETVYLAVHGKVVSELATAQDGVVSETRVQG